MRFLRRVGEELGHTCNTQSLLLALVGLRESYVIVEVETWLAVCKIGALTPVPFLQSQGCLSNLTLSSLSEVAVSESPRTPTLRCCTLR